MGQNNQNELTVMGLKAFFTGKSGTIFWINILLMIVVLVGIPIGGLYFLDVFTHHGEKIEVPNVIGKNAYDAEIILRERGLNAVVSDSTYKKDKEPGAILVQSPLPGNEVKSGRIVYLTKNQSSEPLVTIPDLINNCSKRQAEAQLRVMGFTLTPIEYVEGQPKDLVIGIKQGYRELHAGDKVVKSRPLTLVVGEGDPDTDTIYVDTTLTEEDYIYEEEIEVEEDTDPFI